MQWYLLKTWVGREEEMVKEIQRMVPPQMYKECFVIYQERIWRKQQKSMVQLKPVFPGCAFLTCSALTLSWQQLERMPGIDKQILLGNLRILPMMAEDGRFLEKISGEEHIVRLSYVQKDEEGNIRRLSEPLKLFQGQVDRMQYKKRYAMVYHRLWGEERQLVLGIALKEDVEESFLDGNTLLWLRKEQDGQAINKDKFGTKRYAGAKTQIGEKMQTRAKIPAGTKTQTRAKTQTGEKMQTRAKIPAGTKTQTRAKAQTGTKIQTRTKIPAGTKTQADTADVDRGDGIG